MGLGTREETSGRPGTLGATALSQPEGHTCDLAQSLPDGKEGSDTHGPSSRVCAGPVEEKVREAFGPGWRSVHPRDPERHPGSDHEAGRSLSCPRVSLCRGYQTHMDWETEEGEPFPYFVYGAACSEVEVDCLTGAHKVERGVGAPTFTE